MRVLIKSDFRVTGVFVCFQVLMLLSCKENSAPTDFKDANSNQVQDDLELKHVESRSNGAVDPGLRGGASGSGNPLPGLTPNELAFFDNGKGEFVKIDSVTGSIANTGSGLGPTFNSDSCISCHSYPAIGGSSPTVNPLIAIATREGATNKIPFFIEANGPIREARFKYQMLANGKLSSIRDGGVHNLFTIEGRSDAGVCGLSQPNFLAAARANNLVFRIPTPMFGGGLIEAIPDAAIIASHNNSALARMAFNINGRPNRNGNDGTIARFGWKAQNKSLLIFAGEAYNVEMGVANEAFPNKRVDTKSSCMAASVPSDATRFEATEPMETLSDIEHFTVFMRMLAPPQPRPYNSSTMAGRAVFNEIGCHLCHTPSLPVGVYPIKAVTAQKVANLYSDLLIHRMGYKLADDVVQGSAGPDEFRTAPLWGLGQRVFFLHDGRTKDLVEAIRLHASPRTKDFPPSEANEVIARFNRLGTKKAQDLMNFLRSL